MKTALEVSAALIAAANPEKIGPLGRFFKTGPGQYGEGDQLIGLTVPSQRIIAKQAQDLPLTEIEKLLMSPWHEERLTSLLIMVLQYKKAKAEYRKELYEFYMSHTKSINNWDLVDTSAEYIVGPYLDGRPEQMQVLEERAHSDLLWDRRIAMLATFDYIKRGRADEALIIAELLLHDSHDLIQKAVGWMLREIGKRVDQQLLLTFLDMHAATMPRTSLRYAIERLSSDTRKHYLTLKDK